MPTYQRCDDSVTELAADILTSFDTHRPILDARVKIDFVFARPDYDEKTGEPKNDAIKKNGIKALGLCRKIPLKDRALDRGDAEICLDYDWWQLATLDQRRALLDHELHHIEVKTESGDFCRDDLGRPLLKMRKHDAEFGWFAVVAARHGKASIEQTQARALMDTYGQFFWPQFIAEEVPTHPE